MRWCSEYISEGFYSFPWPRQERHRPASLQDLRVTAVDSALMLWTLTNLASSNLSVPPLRMQAPDNWNKIAKSLQVLLCLDIRVALR